MSIFDNVRLINERTEYINSIRIESHSIYDDEKFSKDIKNNNLKAKIYNFVNTYRKRINFNLSYLRYIDREYKSDISEAMRDVCVKYKTLVGNKIELVYIFNYNRQYYIDYIGSYSSIELKQVLEYIEDKDIYREIASDDKSITDLIDYLRDLNNKEYYDKQDRV